MPSEPLHDWRSRILDSAGSPRLKANGLPVADVLRTLADGPSAVDGASADEVRACLLYAAELLLPDDAVTLAPTPVHEAATLAPASSNGALTLDPAPNSEALTLAAVGDTLPGDRRVNVPGYEILGELGRGGMGVVYKARQVRLDRIVALKMILAGEHAGEDALARFQREAEVVARVQHPGIVQIHEIGEAGGHSFLALEFVAGGSLAARLDQTPWKGEDAAALVEKIARAVHFAHERGIVHRDLKPENILLDEQGEPKVADFGLAKRLEETGQTKTGDVMGTPSYMAPEQAAGKKEIGPAADVYALGGILYRLLAGRPPFEGQSTFDILMRVLDEEPFPLRRMNQEVPRDLETICLKCLAKEPARRYDSAAELADDLQRHLDGEPIRARQMTSAERAFRFVRKHPMLALCRGLVILFAVGVSFVQLLAGLFMGLGMMLILAVLLVGWLSAPGRKLAKAMLVSVPVGLLVGILSLAGVFVLRPNLLDGLMSAPAVGTSPLWFTSPFILASLPIWVGLGYAVFQRHQWKPFLIALGLLALGLVAVPAFRAEPTFIAVPLATAVLFIVGLPVRLIQKRWGGNGIDILCGLLAGGMAGGAIGSLLSGCLLLAALGGFVNTQAASRPNETIVLLFLALLYGASFLMSFASAALGGIWAAKYTERMSKPRSRLGESP